MYKILEKLKEVGLEHYFRPKWYSIFINPYFIARYSLFKKINKFSKQHNWLNKNILDVGCGIKPYESLFKGAYYVGIDIEGGGHKDEKKKIDILFDGKNIPFDEKSFDLIICTQVLEHTLDYEYLLKEMYRVLKDDGILLITAPLVWNEHEIPYDFFRFTKFAYKEIFSKIGFKIITIQPTTTFFATIGQLLSAFLVEMLSYNKIILKIIISLIFCFPVQILFLFLDLLFKSHWLTLDYFVIARKIR